MLRALALLSLILVGAAPTTPTPVWKPPVERGTLEGDAFAAELQTVDLNGDGLRDAVIGRWLYDRLEPVPLTILLNRGGGHFVDVSKSIFDGPPPKMEGLRQLVIADFNDDGRPDIFVVDKGSANMQLNPGWPGQQNRLILSTPDGQLRDATANLPQHRTFTESETEATGASVILKNDGAGNFTPFESLPPKLYTTSGLVIDIRSADINGDGSPDLLLEETQNNPFFIGTRVQELMNDGHGHFTDETSTRLRPPLPDNVHGSHGRLVIEDLNDDGRLDLAVSYEAAGSPSISDPTPVWINHDGVLVRQANLDQGLPPDLRGPVGFVNGAGPHAMLSVESHPSGDRSAPRYFVAPQITTPAAPTGLRAVATGKRVLLTWKAVAGADRYEVWLSTRRVATTTRTSYDAQRPGRYRVRAVNASGASPFSAAVR